MGTNQSRRKTTADPRITIALCGFLGFTSHCTFPRHRPLTGCGLTKRHRQRNPIAYGFNNGHKQVAYFFLERGANVSAQDATGKTALHLPSQKGHVEVAQMLIERGADVSAQDRTGDTVLHLALFYGHVEVAQIECGADVSAQNRTGQTALHKALYLGRGSCSDAYRARRRCFSPDETGMTALYLASRSGHVEVAQMLIERGADVSARDETRNSRTALHEASRTGNVKVAQMLIERGADVSAQDWTGKTALHVASQAAFTGVAHMLIRRGADVSAQDKDGQTPLHLASTDSFFFETSPKQRAEITRILSSMAQILQSRTTMG